MNEPIPTYPQPLKKPVDAVARSLARPDAFAKPASFSSKPVRVRVMGNTKSVHRRKKRDPRDVKFW